MPLHPDVLGAIEVFVRGGFEGRDRIVEILCEEMYAPGTLAEAEVSAAVDAAFDAIEQERTTWPDVTDCDRLDAVFRTLNALGIIAVENAGFAQDDGYDGIKDMYQARPECRDAVGYCFYHTQDLERAVLGQGLYLAFGPMDPALEQSEGPRLGAMIVEELRRAGFSVQWDGTFARRIFVPQLDWKRR